jgi:hypothetical protein
MSFNVYFEVCEFYLSEGGKLTEVVIIIKLDRVTEQLMSYKICNSLTIKSLAGQCVPSPAPQKVSVLGRSSAGIVSPLNTHGTTQGKRTGSPCPLAGFLLKVKKCERKSQGSTQPMAPTGTGMLSAPQTSQPVAVMHLICGG